MRRRSIRALAWAAMGLLLVLWMGLAEAEIPLPEGAVARLGLGEIRDVKFSPDGRYLAVATSIGIELREAESFELVRFLSGHTGTVTSVAFSPDGSLLASGSWDQTIKLWEVATGQEVRTLSGHSSTVSSVAFSPDGRLLASGSWDGTVLLWDATRFKAPKITSLIFPPTIKVKREQNGLVKFEDPEGNIVQAQFEILEGDPATIQVRPGLSFDPKVQGRTQGSFGFSVIVTKPQTVRLSLTLIDSAGLRSEPYPFTFKAEE